MLLKTEHPLLYKITLLFYLLFIVFSGISISVSQGALLVAFVLWAYGLFRGIAGCHYRRTGLERYILTFIIISIILAFLSPSIINNLLYLKDFWLISAFVLTFSLINTKSDFQKIVFLIACLAIFQFAVGFLGYLLNLNFLNAINYGTEDPRSYFTAKYICGFLGHHLTYSGYMMMLFIPLSYMFFLKKKDIKEIPAFLIKASSVMSFIAIILSWSRSVIIALPFATVPLFFKRKKSFILIFGLIVIALFFVFSKLGPAKNITDNFYNVSSKIRIQIWKNVFNVCKSHPIIGTGGSNYDEVFKEEVNKNLKERKLFIQHFPSRVTHAHNDYLNQLARKGIIGFLAFLYMLYGIFKYMLNNLKNINDKFLRYAYMGLFGSFTAFLMASMFQCYFTDEENLVMLWLNVGLLVSIVKIGTGEEVG